MSNTTEILKKNILAAEAALENAKAEFLSQACPFALGTELIGWDKNKPEHAGRLHCIEYFSAAAPWFQLVISPYKTDGTLAATKRYISGEDLGAVKAV